MIYFLICRNSGKELAIELYQLGANIIICSRSRTGLQKCAEECVLMSKESIHSNDLKNKILIFEIDLEKYEDIPVLISSRLKDLLDSSGLIGIDILINNAGVSSRGYASETTLDSLKAVMV